MSKLNATTSPAIKPAVTTATTPAAVTETKSAAPVTTVAPVVPNLDIDKVAKAKEFAPKGGTAVSKTASNDALWGDGAKPASLAATKPSLEVMSLKSLNPTQRTEKMAALKEEAGQLRGRISKRAEEVDRRWDYSRLTKRADVLREYVGKNTLPPEAKAKVEAALAKADAAQVSIEGWMERKKGMGPKGSPTGGTKEERTAMAREMMGYRKAQSEAIHEADAVITSLGLKVDLLADAEATIDPNGAETSEYGSLQALVSRYYEVMFSINTLQAFGDPLVKVLNEATKRMSEDERKRDIILAQWTKREEVKATALALTEFQQSIANEARKS